MTGIYMSMKFEAVGAIIPLLFHSEKVNFI
jgi:hypothetical protein